MDFPFDDPVIFQNGNTPFEIEDDGQNGTQVVLDIGARDNVPQGVGGDIEVLDCIIWDKDGATVGRAPILIWE